jgi:hypothetical protein
MKKGAGKEVWCEIEGLEEKGRQGGMDGMGWDWMEGINQAGELMNESCLYWHTTTTGALVGWFLLVLLWPTSICPTSLSP